MHDFKIKQVHSSTKPVCKAKWNLEWKYRMTKEKFLEQK